MELPPQIIVRTLLLVGAATSKSGTVIVGIVGIVIADIVCFSLHHRNPERWMLSRQLN